LYSSVTKSPEEYNGAPPNAKPAFCVPAPPAKYLPADKAPPADHAPAPVTPYANPTLPDTCWLPDIIAEPVYGNGSVSKAAPFCKISPITLSDPDMIAEPEYGNGSDDRSCYIRCCLSSCYIRCCLSSCYIRCCLSS
jgi:hypothetical protein